MTDDRSCCVNCRHFDFTPGSPGYSEWTPGDSMAIQCLKEHWYAKYDTYQDQFREYMLSSKTCKDFVAREP